MKLNKLELNKVLIALHYAKQYELDYADAQTGNSGKVRNTAYKQSIKMAASFEKLRLELIERRNEAVQKKD